MTHAIQADGGGYGIVTPQFYDSSDGPDKAGILMGSLVRVRVGDNWGGRVRVRVHSRGMIVIVLIQGGRDGSGFFLGQLDGLVDMTSSTGHPRGCQHQTL